MPPYNIKLLQVQKELMGRNKISKQAVSSSPKKTKKVQKAEKLKELNNKISIKKAANQKEVVAEFPFIRIQNGQQVMAIPLYRNDKLDYTPGFSLPDQFTKTFISEQKALQEYRVSSETSVIDVQNIKQPKPSSRNSYCTICKIRFEDYKEHIQLETHLAGMRGSAYNKFIEELCQKKKIERFFMNSTSKQETAMTEKSESFPRIFLEEQEIARSQRVFGNTKQSLYALVKEQFKKQNPISPMDENLFDVLQC